MSFSKDSLPVYAADDELLYYASFAAAERLLESGRVTGRGTRHRIRALVAVCGSEELLRAARVPTGQRFSNNNESDDNPRGVWTHNLRLCVSYCR